MHSTADVYSVSTSQGRIALWDPRGEGAPVLFLHGNSACRQVWEKQFSSELAKKYRFIALDLPGHGKSDKPKDRQNTYTYQGYAVVVNEVMNSLQLQRPIIVAWSLSAYIAFALLSRKLAVAGLLITGAAPIPFNKEGKMDMERAFNLNSRRLTLLAKEQLTDDEAVELVSTSGFNPIKEPFMLEAALKADGYARSMIIQNRNDGKGCCDCKALVETLDMPLCVVEGANDPLIKLSYLKHEIHYKHLFKKEIYVIDGAGHAPFWDQPEKFNVILFDFLSYVSKDMRFSTAVDALKN